MSLVENYIKMNSQIIDLDEKRIGIRMLKGLENIYYKHEFPLHN